MKPAVSLKMSVNNSGSYLHDNPSAVALAALQPALEIKTSSGKIKIDPDQRLESCQVCREWNSAVEGNEKLT